VKYTNKFNLPESVVNLLTKDRYSAGEDTDFSVTTLLQPPRITQLKRRHWDELEEEMMDGVWSLFGQIAHSLLEEHGAENALAEERVKIEILDRVISGQVDSYHDGIITDYKVTSAWTLVYGSRLHEWTEQLNLYAYLFKSAGYAVTSLRICTILRDWDKKKAQLDHTYPQTPIVIIPIDLWTHEHQEAFIYDRVLIHKEAEPIVDFELPLCTPEEMWEQPAKWAVMKEGQKKAVRVYGTEEEAFTFAGEQANAHLLDVVKRPGKRTRCLDYCSVCSFCNSYQDYLRSQEE
jgi:hypothetical protein